MWDIDVGLVGSLVKVDLMNKSSLVGLVYTVDPQFGHIILLQPEHSTSLASTVCMGHAIRTASLAEYTSEAEKLIYGELAANSFAKVDDIFRHSAGGSVQESSEQIFQRVKNIIELLDQARIPYFVQNESSGQGDAEDIQATITQQNMKERSISIMDKGLRLVFPFEQNCVHSSNPTLIKRFKALIFKDKTNC